MDKSNETLINETRTIIYVLHSIAAGSGNWDEDIPRQEMVHLLRMARIRLDMLCSADWDS